MPIPNLPPEILSIIIEFARLPPKPAFQYFEERETAALAQVALVSRAFLHLARRALYPALFVPLMVPLDLRDPTTHAQRSAPSESTKLLRTSLAVSPHLATLVRSVVFDFSGSEAPVTAELLAFLLKTCPNLVDLTMFRCRGDRQYGGLA